MKLMLLSILVSGTMLTACNSSDDSSNNTQTPANTTTGSNQGETGNTESSGEEPFVQFNIQDGYAISGADPVAYFTESEYVQGDESFSHEWKGATFLFSTAANRDLFIANPESYAPQYGGYCSYAMSRGGMAGIDPQAFDIVDDKLYLNLSLSVRETWRSDQANYIQLANGFWPGVLEN